MVVDFLGVGSCWVGVLGVNLGVNSNLGCFSLTISLIFGFTGLLRWGAGFSWCGEVVRKVLFLGTAVGLGWSTFKRLALYFSIKV